MIQGLGSVIGCSFTFITFLSLSRTAQPSCLAWRDWQDEERPWVALTCDLSAGAVSVWMAWFVGHLLSGIIGLMDNRKEVRATLSKSAVLAMWAVGFFTGRLTDRILAIDRWIVLHLLVCIASPFILLNWPPQHHPCLLCHQRTDPPPPDDIHSLLSGTHGSPFHLATRYETETSTILTAWLVTSFLILPFIQTRTLCTLTSGFAAGVCYRWDVFLGSALCSWTSGRSRSILERCLGTAPLGMTLGLFWAEYAGMRVASDGEHFALRDFASIWMVWVLISMIGSAHTTRRPWRFVGYCESALNRFVSFYTFFWIWPALDDRCDNKSFEERLPDLPSNENPSILADEFLSQSINSGLDVLIAGCYSIQPNNFWISFGHGWLYLTMMQLDPLLLHALLSSNEATSSGTDLLLAFALSASMLIRVSCMEICFFYSVRTMTSARSALLTAMFKTVIRRENLSTNIDIPNLISSDVDNLGNSGWVVFFLASWSFALVSLPLTCVILARFVGWGASLAGVSVLILGGTITKRLAEFAKPLFESLQKLRDVRSGLTRSALTSMLAIKMFSDEPRRFKDLRSSRENELNVWLKVKWAAILNGSLSSFASAAVPVAVFFWVTQVDKKQLTSADAFTTLLMINQISWSAGTLPDIFKLWSSLTPSGNRLFEFFGPGGSGKSKSSSESARLPSETTQHDSPLLLSGAGQRSTRSPSESAQRSTSESARLPSVESAQHDSPLLSSSRSVQRSTRDSPGDAENDDDRGPILALIYAHTEIGFDSRLFGMKDQLVIKRGQLVFVQGPVGSGKSALLSVLAGACVPFAEQRPVTLCRRRAIVEQKPFLLNGTLQDNILFGDMKVDDARYGDCIKRAALDRDLKALPRGSQTPVGDGGVQLSGGQRVRVAFARALYSQADLYVLDDLFSAVDEGTAKTMWNDAVLPLLEQGKSVVLAASHEPFREIKQRADVVVTIDYHQQILVEYLLVKDVSFVATIVTPPPTSSSSTTPMPTSKPTQPDDLSLEECRRVVKVMLSERVGRVVDETFIVDFEHKFTGQLDDDDRDATETGTGGHTITKRDMNEYWSVFGLPSMRYISVVLLCGSIALCCALELLGPFWLAHWTETHANGLAPYVMIQLLTIVVGAASCALLTWMSLAASRLLHDQALSKLLSAPMSLFDSVPAGRLFNVLMSDLRSIDESLPDGAYSQLKRTMAAAMQIVVVALLAPFVLVVLPLLFTIYKFILDKVRSPSRDSKRIEAAARGPVYSGFFDALRGKATIRAFNKQEHFVKRNVKQTHDLAVARISSEAINKWAQALAVQTGCLLYFACGVVGVFALHRGDLSIARLALLLTFAGVLQRTGMDWMMGWTGLESSLVSVERFASLLRIAQTEDVGVISGMSLNHVDSSAASLQHLKSLTRSSLKDLDAVSSIGTLGVSIEFRDVQLRYRLYRPLILKGISFHFPGGSKIALRGRTGSGKSSIFLALLAVYPLCGGSIRLNDVDMVAIPLRVLRSRLIRVLLQDPLLTRTTVRENIVLDEEMGMDDFRLREILRSVGLGSNRKLMDNLDLPVGPDGGLLSVGERQLVRLCSIFVGKPNLILCDEATSAADDAVEKIVQDALLAMKGVTVVSVLHRNTHVARYDWILTLEDGKIKDCVKGDGEGPTR